MMKSIVILCLWLLTKSAYALEVPVRTGEHGDFTRITISFPEPPIWKFGRDDGKYQFRESSLKPSYQLERAYIRIDRNRIANILNGKSGVLLIDVGCKCHANVFEINNLVVIDVIDGVGPSNSVFEKDINTQIIDENGQSKMKSLGDQVSKLEEWEYRDSDGFRRGDSLLPIIFRAEFFPSLLFGGRSNDSVSLQSWGGVGQIRENGILKSYNTEQERANNEKSESELKRIGGCIEDEIIDVSSWGDGAEGGADFSSVYAMAIGREIYNEVEVIEDLIKLNLYLTFGSEARQLLDLYGEQIPNSSAYRLIADVMDGSNTLASDVNYRKDFCTGRVAMWRLLNNNQAIIGGGSFDKVIHSFSELPAHLRDYLGYRLIVAFLKRGDLRAAQVAKNIIDRRSDGGALIENLIVEGDLEELTNDGTERNGRHRYGIDINAYPLPFFLSMVEKYIRSKVDVPKFLVEELGMYSGSQVVDSTRNKAIIGRIQSLSHNRNFSLAMEEMEKLKEDLPRRVILDLTVGVIDMAIREGVTHEILDLLQMQIVKDVLGDMESDLVDRVSTYLIDVGLPSLARKIVLGRFGVPSRTQRFMIASSYLLERRPDMVFSYISGLKSEGAMELAARAFVISGEYEQAGDIMASMGRRIAANSLYWRAGVWPESNAISEKWEVREGTFLSQIESEIGILIQNGSIIKETISELDEGDDRAKKFRGLIEQVGISRSASFSVLSQIDISSIAPARTP